MYIKYKYLSHKNGLRLIVALKMLQMTISQCFHCVASQMMDFLPIVS